MNKWHTIFEDGLVVLLLDLNDDVYQSAPTITEKKAKERTLYETKK